MKTPSRSVLAAIATTTLFAVPAVSQASSYQTALDACVKAFMSSNFVDRAPLKVLESNSQSTSLLPSYTRSYSFTLTAIGASTGKRYAQSTCTTSKTGSVTIEGLE